MDEKIFGLLEKLYSELTSFRTETNRRLDNLESDMKEVKRTVIKIEDEHGDKLKALFDGYQQNSEILARVEQKVAKHEEVIIRKVK